MQREQESGSDSRLEKGYEKSSKTVNEALNEALESVNSKLALKEQIINKCYEMIRDAQSTETIRAI